jgi:hypothetical protein
LDSGWNKIDLHGEFFLLIVPIGIKLAFSMVYLLVWYFKSDIFVRFGCKYQVLIVFFRNFHFLFERRHYTVTGSPVNVDFWEINFKQQRFLSYHINYTQLFYLLLDLFILSLYIQVVLSSLSFLSCSIS